MFTGIIEAIGNVVEVRPRDNNVHYFFECPFSQELKIDQSVSHNGICLTVTEIQGQCYSVVAIAETLSKTNLRTLTVGSRVNLERAMRQNDRLDGHLVQGHIDVITPCTRSEHKNGSWDFWFRIPPSGHPLIIPRGSIAINGVSLTIADIENDQFKVSIIPYTFEHTNFKNLQLGDWVNLEYDLLGKYVVRYMRLMGEYKKGPVHG